MAGVTFLVSNQTLYWNDASQTYTKDGDGQVGFSDCDSVLPLRATGCGSFRASSVVANHITAFPVVNNLAGGGRFQDLVPNQNSRPTHFNRGFN